MGFEVRNRMAGWLACHQCLWVFYRQLVLWVGGMFLKVSVMV